MKEAKKSELWTSKDELLFKMGNMHGEVPMEKPKQPAPTKPIIRKVRYIPQERK